MDTEKMAFEKQILSGLLEGIYLVNQKQYLASDNGVSVIIDTKSLSKEVEGLIGNFFIHTKSFASLDQFIENSGMVYGTENVAEYYNIELSSPNYLNGDYLLSVKYNLIIGSRKIGVIKKEDMHPLFFKIKEMLNSQASFAKNIEPQKEKQDSSIMNILPALKQIEYTNDDCTELKLHGQIPAKDYQLIKKIFEDMGGKWKRSSGTHVFNESPIDRITEIIETGVFKKTDKLGYFPTQKALAEKAIADLKYFPGMDILEPEIGQGHFADVIKEMYPDANIFGYEVNPKNLAIANQKHHCVLGDFLQQEPEAIYDAVIMNPPFEKQQDIAHVTHAMKFLRPGGQLIAIMSPSFTFRNDKKSIAFREMLESHGFIITENGVGAFKESGTMINTVTIKLTKPMTRKHVM